MRSLFTALLCLPSLLALALAADDPDYNASQSYRPKNVTGLTWMYPWVGSYYNATAEITVVPRAGENGSTNNYDSKDLCSPLQNYTVTQKWNAILTIAERGTYNAGSNVVNLYLNLIPLDNSWATTIDDPVSGYPLWEMVMSSSSELLDSDLLVSIQASDLLNMTTTKSKDEFRLTSESFGNGGSLGTGSFHMPACDTSVETGNWSLGIVPFSKERESKYWNWTDYAAPSMNVSFDDHTANLTLTGTFEASAYGIGSSESDPALWGSNTMGDIRVVFQGVLDGYHSDVLDMNGTMPTWLRTVGFGNNSLNIDNDAVSAGDQLRPAQDVWGMVVLFTTITIIVSASIYH